MQDGSGSNLVIINSRPNRKFVFDLMLFGSGIIFSASVIALWTQDWSSNISSYLLIAFYIVVALFLLKTRSGLLTKIELNKDFARVYSLNSNYQISFQDIEKLTFNSIFKGLFRSK
jgi:hypothetical protein